MWLMLLIESLTGGAGKAAGATRRVVSFLARAPAGGDKGAVASPMPVTQGIFGEALTTDEIRRMGCIYIGASCSKGSSRMSRASAGADVGVGRWWNSCHGQRLLKSKWAKVL